MRSPQWPAARIGGTTKSNLTSFTLLAGAAALIIDVRGNPGGSPSAVALICGYLFDERTYLNDIAARSGESVEQFWTPGYVPGRRFGGTKPVYVLTGPESFSGAEDLAYSLQQRGRATIVGERTKGGANPCEQFRVGEHLQLTVSTARAVNPISGTNWEGVGVRPDVPVAADHAFDTAYALAREAIRRAGQDSSPHTRSAVKASTGAASGHVSHRSSLAPS